jgi:hypothetical protein
VKILSDKTTSLEEGDYFYVNKMSSICRKLEDKKVTTRIHDHRGKLFIVKNALCIIDKVAWYAEM